MNPDLASYSLIAVYSAMTVYAIAFICFALDLARRASLARPAAVVPVVRVAATVGSGTTALLDREDAPAIVDDAGAGSAVITKRSTTARLGMYFTILGWILHLGGDVLRGVAAGRVPWANMFEFSLTMTAIIIGVFLVVQFWQDLRFLGVYITGFVTLFLGLATTEYYVAVSPLSPPLQSYWLVIHVFVASLGTGFFGLGAALSVVQLLASRRAAKGLRSIPAIPTPERLEMLAYRLVVVGFVFWTFTLMAGAIWADHAWGRYWGWDTKEVWTFIVWVIFAGYIHARATPGMARLALGDACAIIGFGAVLFNFTIVNIFFHGLHSYSGL